MSTKFAISILMFCSLLHVNAQQLSRQDEFFIDSIFNAEYKPETPGAVILVARNGRTIFRKAYGMANLELKVSNKPENIFPIASLSKQFVAVCMLQLVQQGKVSLSADIRKYLKNYNSHGRTITVRDLLSHTSGIPSYDAKPDFAKKLALNYSKDEVRAYFENDSLMFEPGTDFSYSNSGYMLAGLIIEKVSGLTFEDYIRKNLLEPLRMTSTFTGTREVVIPGLATGYENVKEFFRPAPNFSWSWPYVGAYLLSCVDDLLKWDEALYNNSILSQALLQESETSSILSNGITTNYGLGWRVWEFKGTKILTHHGIFWGFRSYCVRIPSSHLYLVVLSNQSKSVSHFSTDIALRLTGKSYQLPPVQKLQSSQLQQYEGVFELARSGSGTLTLNYSPKKMYRKFFIRNDSLLLEINSRSVPLTNIGKDLFLSFRTFYKFHRNKEQIITSLEVYNEPNTGPKELVQRIFNKQ